MFVGVICENFIISNEIIIGLYVKKMYDICFNVIEFYNVMIFDDGIYMRYCGSLFFFFFLCKIEYIICEFKI